MESRSSAARGRSSPPAGTSTSTSSPSPERIELEYRTSGPPSSEEEEPLDLSIRKRKPPWRPWESPPKRDRRLQSPERGASLLGHPEASLPERRDSSPLGHRDSSSSERRPFDPDALSIGARRGKSLLRLASTRYHKASHSPLHGHPMRTLFN